MKTVLVLLMAIMLAGCAALTGKADPDYSLYVAAKQNEAGAQAVRLGALAAAAKSPDQGVSAGAVMALALEGRGSATMAGGVQPPARGDSAISWGSLLVQLFGIHRNAQVALHASDNAARVAESANAAMLGLGNHDNPQPAQGQTYNIGGDGVIGGGTLNTVGGTGAAGGDYADTHSPVDSSNQGNADNSNQNNGNPDNSNQGNGNPAPAATGQP